MCPKALVATCLPKLVIASPLEFNRCPLTANKCPFTLTNCPFSAITPPVIALTACISDCMMDFFKDDQSNGLGGGGGGYTG